MSFRTCVVLVLFFVFLLGPVINVALFEEFYCVSVHFVSSWICFSVFGLDPSNILSLKLDKLTHSVKRWFTVITWLWHSSHSGMGRPFTKYQWVSNVWPAPSMLITASSFLHLLVSFHDWVSGLIYLSQSFFSFHSVFHFSCMASKIYWNRSW